MASNFFQVIEHIAAIHSVNKSSKSELSSRFLGRLKIFALFEYLLLAIFRALKQFLFHLRSMNTSNERANEKKNWELGDTKNNDF